jgi:hypothetical protein
VAIRHTAIGTTTSGETGQYHVRVPLVQESKHQLTNLNLAEGKLGNETEPPPTGRERLRDCF